MFTSTFSYTHRCPCLHLWFSLLCTVSGLDNFDVGLSNVFPTEGSNVSSDSYTLCGRYAGAVGASELIVVDCAPISQKFRYVIIRSSDETEERLCISEVHIYPSS